MGFREYNPGLNRFLSRDMFDGALQDLGLGTDPWNANRYMFGGGNPITRVEYGGHLNDTGSEGGGGVIGAALEICGPDCHVEATSSGVNVVGAKTDSMNTAIDNFLGGMASGGIDMLQNAAAGPAAPLLALTGNSASNTFDQLLRGQGAETDSFAYKAGKVVGIPIPGAGAGRVGARAAEAGATAVASRVASKLLGAACSFSGDTLVEMGDGSRKNIADVKVGDEVLATDPQTGERGARKVTHLWVHSDSLLDLVVEGGVLTTTEDHPFWNVTDREYQRADQLDPGDELLSPTGALVRVIGIRAGSQHATTAYNLTVDGIHTYYVVAGATPVLVHNTCGPALGSGNAYSVAYETVISSAMFPGRSRGAHFQAANRDLLAAIDGDADFAKLMDNLIPGVRGNLVGPRGGVSRQSPSALWTWHHAPEEGLMRLVPRIQHEAAGGLQNLFHPGGVGGFAIWGR